MSFQDEDKTAMTPPTPDLGDQTVAVGEKTQVAEPQICPVCGATSSGTEIYCVDCGFLLSETPGEAPVAETAEYPAVLVDHTGREFPLRMGENSLGRDAADVLLADSTVSRKHARITVSESAIEVEGLGSTNGTEVDGERIQLGEKIPLRDGSVIIAGSVRLTLKTAGIQPTAEVERIEEAAPTAEVEEIAPAAWLIPQSGEEFILREGVNTIGRREDNDIRLGSDAYISGRHAELKIQEGIFTLTDLGSTNGTSVNGEKLEPNSPRAVTPDDEMILGQTTFRLRLPEAKEETVPESEEGERTDDGGE